MCVMCSTSVPTLFQYFFYDHIPTFLYIFHEMFFITCIIIIRPFQVVVWFLVKDFPQIHAGGRYLGIIAI